LSYSPLGASARSNLLDQRAGTVRQQPLRHPAEVDKGPFDVAQPAGLALGVKREDEVAPRVAPRGHEPVHLHHLAADQHPLLAEVDLQLLARRRLDRNSLASLPVGDDGRAARTR
jgi:hypothetical protein